MVPQSEPWADEDDAEPGDPLGHESAIGARVDPELAAEEPEPEPRGEPEPTRPAAEPSPASFWRRLGAYLVDSLLLALPVNLLVELLLGRPMPTDIDFAAPAETLEVIWPFSALAFGLELLYFAGMESSTLEATVGKHLLDVQVTDEQAQPISFPRALARNLGKIASALPFGLGFLMIFTSRRNQALHDHIADCLVLDQPDEEPTGHGGEPPGGWQG